MEQFLKAVDEFVAGLLDFLREALPGWVVFLGVLGLLALPIWWLVATFGWMGALLVAIALGICFCYGGFNMLMISIALAILLKTLQADLNMLTHGWWTGPSELDFYLFLQNESILVIAIIIFLVMFALAIPRRAIAHTLAAGARHTHTERNNTETHTREREIHR